MFSYEGKVTVIRKYKGRVLGKSTFHNNGTSALFGELCRCLVKGADSSRYYPYYLDLAAVSSSDDSRRSLLRDYKSPVSDRVVSSEDGYKVVKTFYISYYDLNSSNTNEPENSLVFRLMNDESIPKEFAFVTLVSESNSNTSTNITKYDISEGETHEIIWEMSFSNLSEGTLKVDASGTSSQSLENAAALVVQALEQEVNE